MATPIVKVSDHHYQRTAQGFAMDLKFEDGRWAMYTVNAMVRAYNRGIATPKFFRNLEEVEAKYKTWKGISAVAS